MQIRGLHRAIYRGASLASRLATQERSDAVERRDAVARWHQARRDGLTASQAAKAVGTPLSTLYRWAKDAPPKSRRPKTIRKPAWTTKLVQAVEEWRLEEPTWGKAKLGPLGLRDQGFAVSAQATVGRILRRPWWRAAPSNRRRCAGAKRQGRLIFKSCPLSAATPSACPRELKGNRARRPRPARYPHRQPHSASWDHQALHRLRSSGAHDRRRSPS